METEQFGHPILFIEFQKNKGFRITEESKKFLLTLQNKKLGIISIVGKYRTGKSYLINRMILEQKKQKGFTVGPTINACTKGIWIWSKTLKSKNQNDDDIELLIMDTEGFGGVKEGINHDTRIFLFSLLLSSLFIYNSVGNIDENALQSLSLVLNLAKEIQKQQKNNSQSSQQNEDLITENFPDFLWVVRDFSLKLVDSYNNAINENTYLENSLNFIKGNSDTVEKKNQIRRLIKHFFKNRDCITMVRPVEQEKDLQNLEFLEDFQLRPDFLKQIKKFKKIIMQKTKAKYLNGIVLDGQKFIQLAEAYMQAVNCGKIPDIDTAWNYLKNCENQKIYNKIIDDLEDQDFDFVEEDIDKIIQNINQKIDKNLLGDNIENKKYIQQFQIDIKNLLEKKKQQFEIQFIKFISDKIKQKYQQIRDQIINQDNINLEDIEQDIDDNYNQIVQQYNKPLLNLKLIDNIKNEFDHQKNQIMAVVFKKLKKQRLQEERNKELKILQQEKQYKEQQIQMDLQIKGLNNQLENEQNKKKQIQNQQEQLKIELNKLQSENIDLKQELNNIKQDGQQISNKEVVNLNNKINDLKIELQQQQNQQALKIAQYNQNEAILNQKIEFLEKDNQQIQDNYIKIELQNNNYKNLIQQQQQKELKKQNMLLQQNIVEIKSTELNELKDRVRDFQDLEDNYKKIIRDQENQIQKLQNDNNNQYEQLQNIKDNQNNKLNQTIQCFQKFIDDEKKNKQIKQQEKMNILKKFKQYSLIIQCSKCNKFISTTLFILHLDQCLDITEKENSELNFRQQQSIKDNNLEINISQTLIKEDTKNIKSSQKLQYTEYIVNINDGVKNWYVSRKFRDFCILLSDLQQQHPYLEFPNSCQEIQNFVNDIWGLLGGKSMSIEIRRKKLQKILQDLKCIQLIRQSYSFKKFIGEVKSNQNLNSSSLIAENAQKYYLQRLATEQQLIQNKLFYVYYQQKQK